MIPMRSLRALALCLVALPANAGEVILHDRDLISVTEGIRLATGLVLPAEDGSLPIIGEGEGDAAAELLEKLVADGTAHGFGGILYDNRDRGHSRIADGAFPRLARLVYGLELVLEGADYGLAGRILLPGAVLGNSSTAVTGGPAPRSLVRFAMTRPGQPELQAGLYLSDHLYIYPEHRDHDADDLYPANWTYTLTSQGSSGSDRPFLDALVMTLAAFPPETFAYLRERHLIVPTLQMILRRNLSTVVTREDYLSGVAHPPVFDAAQLRPERMVAEAAMLRPEDVPPMVRIAVEAEDFTAEAGLAGMDERLFDTPSAVARIWRDFSWERSMVLRADATGAPTGAPVTFTWRLLQGDPERVRIEPLDAAGTRARLRVMWHDAFTVRRPDGPRTTSRVDIGVFAVGRERDSAPAFVSISFPDHELRRYAETEAGSGRVQLMSIDYDAIARAASFDPILHWSAAWTDAPVRDDAGVITAWDRTRADGSTERVPSGTAHTFDGSAPERPVLVDVTPSGP